MQRRLVAFLLVIALFLVSGGARVQAQAQPQSEPMERYQANWESLKKYQTPDWFRDAKFGIFIHWGVYSVPAFGSEWYPRDMYRKDSEEYKHHIATYGTQDTFGYKDFVPMFKANHFDPK